MTLGFLSDHDIELYVRLLWAHFQKEQWEAFGVSGCQTFQDVGLSVASTDREVWIFCQRKRLLLITGNRNMEDEDSLENVIRELNTYDALRLLQSLDQKCCWSLAIAMTVRID